MHACVGTKPNDAIVIYIWSSKVAALNATTGELVWVYVPYRTFVSYFTAVLGGGRLFLNLSERELHLQPSPFLHFYSEPIHNPIRPSQFLMLSMIIGIAVGHLHAGRTMDAITPQRPRWLHLCMGLVMRLCPCRDGSWMAPVMHARSIQLHGMCSCIHPLHSAPEACMPMHPNF